MSVTKTTAQRLLYPLRPALFPKISWPERVRVVSTVVIPALAPTLDRSLKQDRTLCPVRALRFYVDRTKDMRQGKELLFVSFMKGFNKDIAPATISSWIKQTIVLCYKLSDKEVYTLHRVKAHDFSGKVNNCIAITQPE